MYTIKYLLENSNLPGPRGNLELLYAFAKESNPELVQKCLEYINDDLSDSPQEFAGMCGVVGYAVLKKEDLPGAIKTLRKYASHSSWRIREAVAIGVQEIAAGKMDSVLKCFEAWVDGNSLEKRAVVAALCEPKLLKDEKTNLKILKTLEKITNSFDGSVKLDDGQISLRKSLGYGWSVAVAHQPEEGKKLFESYKNNSNKHIRWIMKENLKKNRLLKMDKKWVKRMKAFYE